MVLDTLAQFKFFIGTFNMRYKLLKINLNISEISLYIENDNISINKKIQRILFYELQKPLFLI